MSTYAAMAHDKRNKAITDMRAILDGAAVEKRDLSPEELEQVERAEADAQRWADEAARASRADALAAQASEFRVAVATPEQPRGFDEASELTRIWRAAQNRGAAGYEVDPSTFFRALVIADGHVPTTYSQQVVVYERDYTPMLDPGIVTIMPTADGNPISIPTVTADPAAGGTVTAEGGGITELDMTPGTATLTAYKFGITNLWSSEIDLDNNIGLQDVIARTTARELAQDINTVLTTGTGTVQPTGILTAAGNGGTASGTAAGTSYDTFFAPADLIDLKYTLAQPYRQRGAWMVSTTAHARLRKMRDSNGGWLYQNAPIVGQPDTFDGNAVYENAALAAVASASKSVLFGDFKLYLVRRLPLRVDASIHYKFNTDQIALRTIERVDGVLTDAAGVKYLNSANT